MSISKKVVFSLIGGYVLGRAGEEIFGSETAKKVYRKVATCAFIAKDSIMEQVEKARAVASDIAVDARADADRYQEEKDARFNEGREDDFDEDTEDIEEDGAEEADAADTAAATV